MRRRSRSAIAWMLSVAIAVTFMPIAGGAVYADDGSSTCEQKVISLSEAEIQAEKEKAEAALEKELGIVDEDELAAEPKGMLTAKGGTEIVVPVYDQDLHPIVQDKYGQITVSGPDSNGEITVKGKTLSSADPGDEDSDTEVLKYEALYIGDEATMDDPDSYNYVTSFWGDKEYSFSETIDMKDYEVGYHTIFVTMSDGTYRRVMYVPTLIYGAPDINYTSWNVGETSFTCRYTGGSSYNPGGYYWSSEDLDVYLEYKNSDEGWNGALYEMEEVDEYDSDFEITVDGLMSGASYDARLVFAKTFDYDGTEYFFSGRPFDYVSGSVTLIPRDNKLMVKSIKISKGKNIVKKYKYFWGWRVWYRNGKEIKRKRLYRTYKYRYTKFKVTVKLKKKQDLTALYIGTIQGLYAWKSGNKTTYSQKFVCSGKKKGKKIKVRVQGYREGVGYTNTISKKVKIKK